MNDSFPDTWRDDLFGYPRELLFALLAATTFAFLLLLVRQPRLVLRGLLVLVVLTAGLGVGNLGARSGIWAGRDDERHIIAGGLLAIALAFSPRLIGGLKRRGTHRRLVESVKHDPRRLLVLALAPEISERARRRAVQLLNDPFTLDEISRRGRTRRIKRLAKRRLALLRARNDPAQQGGQHAGGAAADSQKETDGKLTPESFYLPPPGN